MIGIGLLGYGTVGQGLYKIVSERRDQLSYILSDEMEVLRVLVRDLDKKRDVEIDKDKLTLDFERILDDSNISIIVEVTGDLEKGYNYIRRALEKGKHVVTANKAIVSAYFEELSTLASNKGVYFLYEASVGGGIPLIKPLKDIISFNEVSSIEGILNGTCNFILTKMTEEGLSYQDVLKEAQRLGYAEEDPSSDVEGMDTLRKLRILSTLGFGGVITEDDILCDGIENISDLDIKLLKGKNRVVKLIASTYAFADGYCSIVQPRAVEVGSYFANVNLAFNSIGIRGNYIGDVKLFGSGAGMLPTANAVLTDCIDVVLKNQNLETPLRGKGLKNNNKEIFGRYYIRLDSGTEEAFEDVIIEKLHEEPLCFLTREIRLMDLLDKIASYEEGAYSIIGL